MNKIVLNAIINNIFLDALLFLMSNWRLRLDLAIQYIISFKKTEN